MLQNTYRSSDRCRNHTPELVEVVRTLCRMEMTPPDGLAFDPDSVVGEQITVESEYVGARLRFLATLGTSGRRQLLEPRDGTSLRVA